MVSGQFIRLKLSVTISVETNHKKQIVDFFNEKKKRKNDGFILKKWATGNDRESFQICKFQNEKSIFNYFIYYLIIFFVYDKDYFI